MRCFREGVADIQRVEKRIAGKNDCGTFKTVDGNEVGRFGFFVNGEGKDSGWPWEEKPELQVFGEATTTGEASIALKAGIIISRDKVADRHVPEVLVRM